MSIELRNETRQALISSIQRYFKENMDEPIGNMAAGSLLNYVLEEIGPTIYNKAVADAQARIQARVMNSTSKSMRMNSSTGASRTRKRRRSKPGTSAPAPVSHKLHSTTDSQDLLYRTVCGFSIIC